MSERPAEEAYAASRARRLTFASCLPCTDASSAASSSSACARAAGVPRSMERAAAADGANAALGEVMAHADACFCPASPLVAAATAAAAGTAAAAAEPASDAAVHANEPASAVSLNAAFDAAAAAVPEHGQAAEAQQVVVEEEGPTLAEMLAALRVGHPSAAAAALQGGHLGAALAHGGVCFCPDAAAAARAPAAVGEQAEPPAAAEAAAEEAAAPAGAEPAVSAPPQEEAAPPPLSFHAVARGLMGFGGLFGFGSKQ